MRTRRHFDPELAATIVAAVRAGTPRLSVAMEHGIQPAKVTSLCAAAGLPAGKRGRPRLPRRPGEENGPAFCSINAVVTRDRWESADWTKQDVVLAQELGVSRERVRQVRKLLRKGASQNKRLTSHSIALRKWVSENLDMLRDVGVSSATLLCPVAVSAATMSRVFQLAGLSTRRPASQGRVTTENLQSLCHINERGCWEWAGRRNEVTGYALIGRTTGHAFAYRLFNGEPPRGLWVLHKCDNPICVNPEHLYAGTAADNARDREERRRTPTGARIGADRATEVRALFAAGTPLVALAKRYEVCPSTIYNVIRGRTWKQPEDEPEQAVAS